MAQWLKFYLVGIIETSEKSINTFKEILKLKEKIEDKILPGHKVRNYQQQSS